MTPDTDLGAQRNPFLFVVGCQRSGTTLLQRILDHHPLLAVGYDSHFIPRPIKRFGIGVDPPLTPKLVERVRGFKRFARLGLSDEETQKAADTAETYGEFVCNVYSAFGRMHGKPLAGEKSPGYCRHLPHLHALFPWVRTIHLIRDGRDIALSILDWGKGPTKLDLFREEPIAACALWWRRDVLTGRRDGSAQGPDHYFEVGYERLVERTEEVSREITAFLGLPYAEEMLAFHEGKTHTGKGRSAKAAWLPPTKGLRDWRTQMSERDLELFEALAGDVLSTVGYERVNTRISKRIEEEAERCRRWWDANMQKSKGGSGEAAIIDDDDEDETETETESETTPRPTPRPISGTSSSPNPYVFIVGSPRSGTTLLKRMVNSHPEIAITPETHWIPRFFRKRVGLTKDGLVTRAFVRELHGYYKFANMRLDPQEVDELVPATKLAPYADIVSRIFDLYGRNQEKKLVGDKTPGYVQHIELLHRLWPAARFVHLVRDGRDVCLSMLDWDRASRTAAKFGTWEEDPVSTTALWWERQVRLGREAGARLGSALYHEIKYESLVTEADETTKNLAAFLGISHNDSMVRFHEGRTRSDPGMSAKRAWRPLTAGIRDWKKDMSPEHVERFEAICGDLLDELGYPRHFPEPRPECLAHAADIRNRFREDPKIKERTLPAAWAS